MAAKGSRCVQNASAYANKRVLVTGGLGFLGSSLAIQLLELGAQVTIIDSCVIGCGANSHNLAAARSAVRVIKTNIANTEGLQREIRQSEIIFNLAGEISHIHSMKQPERDCQA